MDKRKEKGGKHWIHGIDSPQSADVGHPSFIGKKQDITGNRNSSK
jgi:hypothetical protein